MYGAYDSLFWLLFRGADMLRKNVMNTPADNEKRNQCAEYRRREAIRLIKRNKGECEIIELLHQMNICGNLSIEEIPQSIESLLIELYQEGWVQLQQKESQGFASYLSGEDDTVWDLDSQKIDDSQAKIHIYRMYNGLLKRDQAILDYLRAHGEERFLVRELLARVFGEEEKVTSKMVRDSLEWLVEKELATVEEDENGRLLFRAAPAAQTEE